MVVQIGALYNNYTDDVILKNFGEDIWDIAIRNKTFNYDDLRIVSFVTINKLYDMFITWGIMTSEKFKLSNLDDYPMLDVDLACLIEVFLSLEYIKEFLRDNGIVVTQCELMSVWEAVGYLTRTLEGCVLNSVFGTLIVPEYLSTISGLKDVYNFREGTYA